MSATLGAALFVVAGCSPGDDERVVAASDTAEAEVRAALDSARNNPGRFEGVIDDRSGFNTEFEGEYDATGHMVTARHRDTSTEFDELEDLEELDPASAPGPDEAPGEIDADGPPDVRYLQVGDRAFLGAEGLAPWTEAMSFDGQEHPDGVDPFDGSEWFDITDLEASDAGFMLAALTMGVDAIAPFAMLDELVEVEELGTADVDGTATRTFRAELSTEVVHDALGLQDFDGFDGWVPESAEESPADEEARARVEAIFAHLRSRTSAEAELHLDAGGNLVRSVVTIGVDIEDRYAECMYYGDTDDPMAITVDHVADPEVAIAVPDAASVADPDRLLEILGMDDGVLPGMDDEFTQRYVDADGELLVLQTIDGERTVDEIEDDLIKFGSVIGLDPVAVEDMDHAQLVDAHDRASAALAGMPRTPTVMGDLTRVELVWNVQKGLEFHDLDPSTAESLSDQQLADMIDGYVQEFGIAGDGVWGTPDHEALMEHLPGMEGTEGLDEDLEDLWDADLDADAYDTFGGCPGGDEEPAPDTPTLSD